MGSEMCIRDRIGGGAVHAMAIEHDVANGTAVLSTVVVAIVVAIVLLLLLLLLVMLLLLLLLLLLGLMKEWERLRIIILLLLER